MRIAFAGVAHSHPFTDAATAKTLGVEDIVVFDADDGERLTAFCRQTYARPCFSLAELLSALPDVVIVTTRPDRTASTVRAILDSGIPCFLNKVGAPSMVKLAALDQAINNRDKAFFTSSVLRFAPEVRKLEEKTRGLRIEVADVSIQHSIADFLTPERRWQDEPEDGGGTAVSLGLHGWELLDVVLQDHIDVIFASTSKSPSSDTHSENVVAFIGRTRRESTLVTHKVLGLGNGENYRLSLYGEDFVYKADLSGLNPVTSLGYLDCMRAVLQLAQGAPPPISWERSRKILKTTIYAAELGRREYFLGGTTL